jgi:outer membrane protein
MVQRRPGWTLTWAAIAGVTATAGVAFAEGAPNAPRPAGAASPAGATNPGATSPGAGSAGATTGSGATTGGGSSANANAAAGGMVAGKQSDTLETRLAPAVAGGLTADDVATRSAATSYDAKGKQEALRAADAKVAQAEVGYYPRLNLTASYTRLSPLTPPPITFPGGAGMPATTFAFPVILDNWLGQANLTVPLSDYVLKISQNYAAASGSRRAAETDEQAARVTAASNGRIAYYNWLRAVAQAIIAERTLEQQRAHLTDAQHRFDAGTASKADVMQARSTLAGAELTLEQANNASIYAEDQLRITMHDEPGRRYSIGEDLRADLPPLPDSTDLRALLVESLDHRLEVRALDDTSYSLREQAKAAKAGEYPKIDAFGDVIYANPNSRIFPQTGKFDATWDVGVRLTWSPNDIFTSKGSADQLSAQAAQTEAQKQALLDSIRLEVTQAYQALKQALVAIRTGVDGLAAAEEAYRVRTELFRNGRATSTELTDTEIQLFNASLALVNARADLRVARARLSHAVGRDIPR